MPLAVSQKNLLPEWFLSTESTYTTDVSVLARTAKSPELGAVYDWSILLGSISTLGLPSLGVTVRVRAACWGVTVAFGHVGVPPSRKSVSSDVEGTRPSRVGVLADFS